MKKLTPLKAIRQHCRENCCAGDVKSWKECNNDRCPLKPYRFGKDPKRKGIGGNPQLKLHKAKNHPIYGAPDKSS